MAAHEFTDFTSQPSKLSTTIVEGSYVMRKNALSTNLYFGKRGSHAATYFGGFPGHAGNWLWWGRYPAQTHRAAEEGYGRGARSETAGDGAKPGRRCCARGALATVDR